MINPIDVIAPLGGTIEHIAVSEGQCVNAGDLLILLESMNVHVRVEADQSAMISSIKVKSGAQVSRAQLLITLDRAESENAAHESSNSLTYEHPNIEQWRQRQSLALDAQRSECVANRHAKGHCTARENLARLCDPATFNEYGQLAVAAQRQRRDYEDLKTSTAADGVITGIGRVSGVDTALIVNDYTVLAGTQGYFHHQKIDRMLAIAKRRKTPVIMFTEGGGGRPGETDINTVISGLQCTTFGTWAGLSGDVPRIAIANGYNFAGNAALFGAADITIATESACVGMAGPAMIEGGGLGRFRPDEIGPISTQRCNGVVDIVVENEAQACAMAQDLVALLYNKKDSHTEPEQDHLRGVIPDNRRQTFDIHSVLKTIGDEDTMIELQADYGGSVVTALLAVAGHSIGVMANNSSILGGAIDADAGHKANRFMRLCDDLGLPIVSFCDTPGFMVGPEHEATGAVRTLAELFKTGAHLNVPFYAIVLRKCYGLGAQAMLGGSTSRPDYTVSWPSGEFGAMGLEGAVKLGFKKELAAQNDDASRQALFDKLLAQQYQRGKAIEVASVLELDAVIDPAETRSLLKRLLRR